MSGIVYKKSPQKAYMQVVGELKGYPDQPCRNCAEPVCWYSEAGKREVGLSDICEPCFDFIMWPSDDDDKPAWFSLVERRSQQ